MQLPNRQVHCLLQCLDPLVAPGAPGTEQGYTRRGSHQKGLPIAWQHINLQGRYEFQKQPDPL
jgi:hypothetical protein